jgi:hypothetical protein
MKCQEKTNNMKEEFHRIIQAVADAADLAPCQILCKRRFPETIDARWIAVKLMREEGFYSSRIAELMGMSARNVNYILFSVETRLSFNDKALSNILERARKELRNSREITTKNG